MKKIAITQELLDIANQLDNMKLFNEANTITKIAHIVVAEEYKHDPMVYNPDDATADVQEAHSMDYLDAMEALNKLVESGELEPNELSQIQSILSDSDDEGPDPFKEMSFDDEDMDEDFDDDDMGPEEEPFDYDAMEDEEDMYGGPDSRFPDLDEDDF
jgi:hypothetical protein